MAIKRGFLRALLTKYVSCDDAELLATVWRNSKRVSLIFRNLPRTLQALAQSAKCCRAAASLQNNYPYFHPLYAGQMLKPPHPVARLAYALAMHINPNNHALDGGRATSAMEKEVVREIAAMFGWQSCLGHLCGGGTMANLEALWVAGHLRRGKTILASEQAHYTHKRISGVLQMQCEAVVCDALGRMDLNALQQRLEQGDVGTVVATLGRRRPVRWIRCRRFCACAKNMAFGSMRMPRMGVILRW